MRVPPSTSPGRSPSAIATTTAAWWCGWAFAPREYNGLLRRPPLLFWLLPQLDSALTSTPARPQPAAGRETASRQRPAPNRRSGCGRGAFAPYALRLSPTAAFKQSAFTPRQVSPVNHRKTARASSQLATTRVGRRRQLCRQRQRPSLGEGEARRAHVVGQRRVLLRTRAGVGAECKCAVAHGAAHKRSCRRLQPVLEQPGAAATAAGAGATGAEKR